MIRKFLMTSVMLCVPVVALLSSGCDGDDPKKMQRDDGQLPAGEWQLVFSDDFDGVGLDETKWTKGFGWGMKSGAFAEGIDADNISVTDGRLVLKMENRPISGGDYASGAVNTKDKFFQRYGYFEVRMKAPKGIGFLSAFWAKSNDERWPPEIDFVEILGKQSSEAHFTVHYSVNKEHQSSSGSWAGPDFSADFHVFGCEWSEKEIVWYVDGVERRRTSVGTQDINQAGQPFYLMINTHIGHSWPGYPDVSTPWPAYLEVDWVRVHRKKSS